MVPGGVILSNPLRRTHTGMKTRWDGMCPWVRQSRTLSGADHCFGIFEDATTDPGFTQAATGVFCRLIQIKSGATFIIPFNLLNKLGDVLSPFFEARTAQIIHQGSNFFLPKVIHRLMGACHRLFRALPGEPPALQLKAGFVPDSDF